MAEWTGFDYQEWEANELANNLVRQQIRTSQSQEAQAKAEMDLKLKAYADQMELEGAIKQMSRMGLIPDDPAKALSAIAEANLNAGKTEGVADLLAKAASARNSIASAQKSELAATRQKAAHLSAALEGVTDARGFQSAMMGYIASFPDEFEEVQPILNYDPEDPDGPGLSYEELAKQIRQSAVTEADKALTTMREAEADRAREGANESRLRQQILIPAQAEAARARAEASRKAGSIRTSTITDAEKTIADEYPSIPPERVRVFAVELAERAEMKLRATPAMGRTQALRQAYAEMKAEQKFAGHSPRVPRAGESVRNPAPMPESYLEGRGTQDLRHGKIYRGVGAWASSFFVWDADNREFVQITEDPINYDAQPSYEDTGEEEYPEEEY